MVWMTRFLPRQHCAVVTIDAPGFCVNHRLSCIRFPSMSKRSIPILMLGMTWMLTAFGENADISHILTSRWAVGLENSETQVLDLSWQPEMRWHLVDGGRFVGMGQLRYLPQPGTRPGDMVRGSYAPVSRPALLGDNAMLDLREFYYERSYDDWYVVVGKQQVVWGTADGLKVLDVVNPQSFREFILEDFDQSRIPLWTINFERSIDRWLGGGWVLQLLWIPDRTYHALPDRGASYAFTSPRVVPQVPAGISVELRDPQRPDRLFRDSDTGLRLTGFLGGWDLSFNYLYQYYNQPVLHQNVVQGSLAQVEVVPRYHRTHVIGGTFSRAFGDWVIRGELGYFSDRFFITENPLLSEGVASSAELSAMMGLDWSGFQDTFVSVQLFRSHLPAYRKEIVRPQTDINFTVMMRHQFLSDTLQTSLLWVANMHDGDGMVRPRISYDFLDNAKSWLGADIFYGTSRGLFGQFRNNDRLLLGVEIGI